ncbi:MAG: PfkB family carbohydrate kinase [Pseudomonadota bacterium]
MPSEAEMREAVMQGAAVSDIALPSFEDEAQWFGDADPAATASRYAGQGAATVVVKNGAGAVHYRVGGAVGSVPVSPVASPVDTTAAGDSFNAAILVGARADMPLPDRIARACRLAGMVVQRKGALVPVDPGALDP